MQRLNRITNHLSSNTTDSRIISLGPKPKEYGVDIGLLPNLNGLNSNKEIRDEFWKVGYGLFRNAIDRKDVLKARDTILEQGCEKNKNQPVQFFSVRIN